MNANKKDLTRTVVTTRPEIGWLVGFITGPGSKPGTVVVTRGFIRSITGNVARINTSGGTYLVGLDKVKYRFTK